MQYDDFRIIILNQNVYLQTDKTFHKRTIVLKTEPQAFTEKYIRTDSMPFFVITMTKCLTQDNNCVTSVFFSFQHKIKASVVDVTVLPVSFLSAYQKSGLHCLIDRIRLYKVCPDLGLLKKINNIKIMPQQAFLLHHV